ncbi:251f9bb7-5338-404c-9687-9ef1ae43f17b-CDS [Sclerotinia trifoliorum]|uniref:251f9bb7-5338-404c-9687-9ef1ae43f17b-CDS n=1 Tax=Sclerotinia trifoliorum TaxID=28548 RepID=A0A8H2W0L0_9HELO|nr:251f9bb7-5338-404c-9687-9ef1ae43f17b-CDS [Sclerotinia trifoliorum]
MISTLSCDYKEPSYPCVNRATRSQGRKNCCDQYPVDSYPQKSMYCHKVKQELRDSRGRVKQQEILCGDPDVENESYLNRNFICYACEPPEKTLRCSVTGCRFVVLGIVNDEVANWQCKNHRGCTNEVMGYVHDQARQKMVLGQTHFAVLSSFEPSPPQGGILEDRIVSYSKRGNEWYIMSDGRIATPTRQHARGGIFLQRPDRCDIYGRPTTPHPQGYEPMTATAPEGYSSYFQDTTYTEEPQSHETDEPTFATQPVTMHETQRTQYATAPPKSFARRDPDSGYTGEEVPEAKRQRRG